MRFVRMRMTAKATHAPAPAHAPARTPPRIVPPSPHPRRPLKPTERAAYPALPVLLCTLSLRFVWCGRARRIRYPSRTRRPSRKSSRRYYNSTRPTTSSTVLLYYYSIVPPGLGLGLGLGLGQWHIPFARARDVQACLHACRMQSFPFMQQRRRGLLPGILSSDIILVVPSVLSLHA